MIKSKKISYGIQAIALAFAIPMFAYGLIQSNLWFCLFALLIGAVAIVAVIIILNKYFELVDDVWVEKTDSNEQDT